MSSFVSQPQELCFSVLEHDIMELPEKRKEQKSSSSEVSFSFKGTAPCQALSELEPEKRKEQKNSSN